MSNSDKPYVVGVGGGSGSGKTTFLDRLARQLGAQHCTSINLDHYYRPLAQQPRDEQGEVNFDLPQCIDHGAFLTDFLRLLGGERVEKRAYTFNQKDKEPGIVRLLPAPILLVEGLFLFHFVEIMQSLHLKIFLDVSDEIRLQRRIARDATDRGYPEAVVRYQWEHHVRPAYEHYIGPYAKECDLIVPHSQENPAAVDVIATYVNQKSECRIVTA